MAALFKSYTARKRVLGVIDLDDLLLYWRALAGDELIGPHMAGTFDHLLIDEYQDVNGLQVDIVRALRGERGGRDRRGRRLPGHLRVAGRLRRAHPPFPDHFPEAAVVTLERNYRSTQPVLDVANAVAAQASRAFPKQLRAEREHGTRPELIFCRDEAAQAAEVCERVLEAREQGMDLREQAVLSRTSHDTDLLELELTRRRIPYVKYGGLRYLEAAHVKDSDRAAAPGRQCGRRDLLVPRAAAAGGRRARNRAASARRADGRAGWRPPVLVAARTRAAPCCRPSGGGPSW